MRLVLIRHGEAVAGVENIAGGAEGCRGLTEKGRDEARRLHERLARTGEVQPDAWFVSTLPRAIETAEIVFPDADITRGDAYCEMVPGECDGMPREEARNRYAPEVDGPDEPMSPGGESQRQFNARVAAAVDDLAACHDGREVVVVTHGGFVWGTLHHMFGEMNIAAPANASLTVVRRDGNHGWQLERYNDHAHLFS